MIEIITKKKASEIIAIGGKKGLFFRFDKKSKKYIGIDNSTPEIWVEEFEDLKSCKKWLLGG